MAIASLSVSMKMQFGWSAAANITGSDYGQIQNNSTITKTISVGTSIANAVAGGGDELYSAVTSVSSSSSSSIDLTSLADIMGTSGVSLARVKGIMIRVLSATDDSTIGTAATGINIDNTVTNALSSQSNSGWFANAAEGAANGSKFCIPNGGILFFGVVSAGGVLVDGTHKVIKLTNLDGALAAKVQVSVVGGST